MAVITRDIFPPNITQRIQTPITGRDVVGNLSVSRDRPWGGMLYPVSQPSGEAEKGKIRRFLGL